MRVLVYPHMMEMGGSQMNALELARQMGERGHEMVVFAPDGELVELANSWGLEVARAPAAHSWPSMRNMIALDRLIRERGIDLAHAYEWGPAVELAFGPHLLRHTPLVVSVMSMDVPAHIPTHLPLILGTRSLIAGQIGLRPDLQLIEPPVDTTANSPTDAVTARGRWKFRTDEIVISVVCRLVTEHEKVQGVLDAIDAVEALADSHRLRLLVVGDGEGLEQVSARANAVNSRRGTDTVIVTGRLLDPREAYDAADIMFGMGGSAIKSLAFGKPLVVQGSAGFWRLLDEHSLPIFLEQGWFGHGGNGKPDLIRELRKLLDNENHRNRLGALGRSLAVERFSLLSASSLLEGIYRTAVDAPTAVAAKTLSLGQSAIEVGKYKTVMGSRRLRTSMARRKSTATPTGTPS